MIHKKITICPTFLVTNKSQGNLKPSLLKIKMETISYFQILGRMQNIRAPIAAGSVSEHQRFAESVPAVQSSHRQAVMLVSAPALFSAWEGSRNALPCTQDDMCNTVHYDPFLISEIWSSLSIQQRDNA